MFLMYIGELELAGLSCVVMLKPRPCGPVTFSNAHITNDLAGLITMMNALSTKTGVGLLRRNNDKYQ